jgi:hypothetical protein
MELKKLQQYWDEFPEVSMEERPVLSSDLEKYTIRNPLSDAFYLKNKIIARIVGGSILLLFNLYQLRVQFKEDGHDLYEQVFLFFLLAYFIYFHTRLLLFADYRSLLALRLIPFLNKIETVLDKYILSFGVMSMLAGFYLLAIFEKVLSLLHSGAYAAVSESGFYKWLIIIFLSVSFYILFLNLVIPKYKKVLTAVRAYKDGIVSKLPKK